MLVMIGSSIPMDVFADWSGTYVVQDAEYQLTYTIDEEQECATITGYTGTVEGKLILPDEIEGYPVTSIGEFAFNGCEGFCGSLTLPKGLTSIGKFAFYGCEGFDGSLMLPKGLISIGACAFDSCCNLSGSLILPKGLTSIGAYAFSCCSGLSEVIWPEGLTSIGYGAFQYCNGLTGSLILPEGLMSTGTFTFYDCSGLNEVILPEGLTSIGDYAFASCSGLQKITIPASVTNIDGWPFMDCCDQLTIYCKENSTAHKYAVEKQMQYVLMKEEQESIRVSGADRNITSRQVAMQLKEALGVDKFETAIIAVGKDKKETDALAGSYLAKAKNAPILLTNGTDRANEGTVQYICKNVKDHAKIYILGGEATLSKSLDAALEDLGYEVKRLAGNDRYVTNIAVLKEADISGQTDLLIAVGSNFADSLSASATGKAILFVKPEKKGQLPEELTEDQKAVLEAFKDGNIYILGGTGAVGTKTVEMIAECIGKTSAELECNRISGATRYETSVKIAEKFFPDADEIVIVNGKKAADGLSGGPLAATLGLPLILTKAGDAVASDYAKYQKITSGYVLGGTAAIDEETVNRIFKKN